MQAQSSSSTKARSNAIGRLLPRPVRWLFAMTAVAAAFSAAPVFAHGGAGRNVLTVPRLSVFGLTDDQRLVKFRTRNPAGAKKIGTIYGLIAPDKGLIGIDFRVQDDLFHESSFVRIWGTPSAGSSGRTSTVPPARNVGMRCAIAMASSRFLHSTRW